MRKSITWWTTSSAPWQLEIPLLQQTGVRGLLVIAHSLVGLAIIISGLSWWIKLILLAAVCWLLFYHWQHWVLGVNHSPKQLNYSAAQGWTITLLNNEQIPVVFAAPLWLSQWISLLRVVELDESGKKAMRRFSLILFPQLNNKENYRRLLVLLRFPQRAN